MNNYNIVMCYMYNGKVLNNSKRYAFKAYEEITSDLILVDTCCGFQVAKVVEVLSVEEYKEHYKADVQKEMVCTSGAFGFVYILFSIYAIADSSVFLVFIP